METPSSTRRVTRSQTSQKSSKQADALSRSRNRGNPDRSVLLDITNDSPIVGLATGGLVEKTPSSSVAKNKLRAKQTPGSGEALLRGQVKTLLQRVEEESELVNKLSLGNRPPLLLALLGLQPSPGQLLAPTPANTPMIPALSAFKEDDVLMMPCVSEEDSPKNPPQVAAEALQQEEVLGPCLINRALLFDSPDKSETSDTSTITYQGSGEKSSDGDNSSAWSLQVNTSIQEEDEDGIQDFEEEEEEEEADGDNGREEEDKDCYDDLCEILSLMSVKEKARLPDFVGRHTRFVYNSEDEIEGEEEVGEKKKAAVSPSVLLLKGLPVPEGKHLRFQEEEE